MSIGLILVIIVVIALLGGFSGRFGAGTPRVNDGALLFLQHMLAKMRAPQDGGSRLAIIMVVAPALLQRRLMSGRVASRALQVLLVLPSIFIFSALRDANAPGSSFSSSLQALCPTGQQVLDH